MSRRALFAITLAIVAIAVVALVLKFRSGAARVTGSASSSASPEKAAENAAPPDETIPPTSETLIAEALAVKDITYEESLRQRAYAVFGDPRLQTSFRSRVVNWEAIGPLLDEITEKEATLSKELLDALLPFRVRPNDPRSIVNRPRAEVVKTQGSSTPAWVGLPVPGTQLMVWIQGTEQELRKYVVMAGQVWRAFPPFFTYPLNDQPGRAIGFFNRAAENPNNKVDIYLLDGAELDPRLGPCQDCSLGANAGWTKVDPETSQAQRSSAYVLLDKVQSDDDVIDAMAHELAHASQMAYDTTEKGIGAEAWMFESTATFVAYKVMKALNIRPAWEYRLIDRREPPPPGRPRWPAPPLFNNLHKQLHRTGNDYSGFIFFYYASQELGDGIVKQVWQQASPRGAQGIDAVAAAIKLVDHFPRFTVRNWNREPMPKMYKDGDSRFPRALQPEPVKDMPSDLGLFELTEPVVNLSARYYRFRWSGPRVKKVTVQNFYNKLPNAHVWAIKMIDGVWKEPEDWSRLEQVELCRESPRENVGELILIVSDSDTRQPIPSGHPKPRVLVEDVGCEFIEGSAQSTLRLRDDTQNVTYASSRATLRFRPRTVQDQSGNVQYDLMPTSVTWTVTGTRNDCTLDGRAVVAIPAYLDQALDPTRPAWGYLNVVGKDGGDFHSVQVSAVDANARMRVTCPGNPPVVRMEPFAVQWLLNVLHQPNTHENASAVFKGGQTLDPAAPQNSVPMGPGQALSALQGPDSPVAGFITPEMQRALKEAQESLNRSAAENSGKMVYSFLWELRPMSGTPPPAPQRSP